MQGHRTVLGFTREFQEWEFLARDEIGAVVVFRPDEGSNGSETVHNLWNG